MKVNENKTVNYTCPIHPEVTSNTPEDCPQCGMALVPGKGNKIMKANEGEQVTYKCPIHAEVDGNTPEDCPKCGMTLVRERRNKRNKRNKITGQTFRMWLCCLLPLIAILLLPVFGIQINLAWVLLIVMAACCLVPMLFMGDSHSKK